MADLLGRIAGGIVLAGVVGTVLTTWAGALFLAAFLGLVWWLNPKL